MKYIKVMISLLIFASPFAQADESSIDKVKNGAIELWEKTKVTTSEITSSASNKASEVSEKASEIGNKVSKDTKETGAVVWDKMKEVGNATADGARKGASKIREYVGDEKCEEDSALCYK
ncbi:hypothetical protein [Marinomonas ushuaiensis]|nr:hypothetical protein [Marinomonas ushuaiensis]